MASASKPFANEGEEEFDERRQLVRGKNTPDKNGKADTVIKDYLKDTQVKNSGLFCNSLSLAFANG